MAEGTQNQETDRIFDRETLLDLTVNFIPLGIILFFVVLFALFRPFGVDLVATVIMMGLLIIPFAALAVLTYFAGKVISEAEKAGESETAATVAETAIGVGEGPADDADTESEDDAGDDRSAIEDGTSGERSESGAGDGDGETENDADATAATDGETEADENGTDESEAETDESGDE